MSVPEGRVRNQAASKEISLILAIDILQQERICIKYCPNYTKSGSDPLTNEQITEFFTWSFDYNQFATEMMIDGDDLVRMYEFMPYRLASEDKHHDQLIKELKDAFSTYGKSDKVAIKFLTRMYVGKLS